MEELLKSAQTVSAPKQLKEEEVKAASEGKGEQVLREMAPARLSEEEVKAASEGKGEQVLRKHHEKGKQQR